MYFEEYECGCVSEKVQKRRELLGYCRIHGENRRSVFVIEENKQFISKRRRSNSET